jgi:hypothetical protein
MDGWRSVVSVLGLFLNSAGCGSDAATVEA